MRIAHCITCRLSEHSGERSCTMYTDNRDQFELDLTREVESRIWLYITLQALCPACQTHRWSAVNNTETPTLTPPVKFAQSISQCTVHFRPGIWEKLILRSLDWFSTKSIAIQLLKSLIHCEPHVLSPIAPRYSCDLKLRASKVYIEVCVWFTHLSVHSRQSEDQVLHARLSTRNWPRTDSSEPLIIRIYRFFQTPRYYLSALQNETQRSANRIK